eukprot:CAMPEP_0117654264 /NCGR_PEP_ID=MMETSP0804-20121206/3650_1 /TAXON_ID=1074897 /ORGANISM="Tetraselmis astigmatica, Strain CCMP880" /LENGTH=399 /DNA_ID=CAMNT_0005460531 /DNA_START=60 /DNA_END=1260 /DNA_ORIENTATION=-
MPPTGPSLDTPLLKVPYDSLRRRVRDRKYVEKEMDNVVAALKSNADNSILTNEQRVQDIDKLISKLTRLKRKVTEMSKNEEQDIHRCSTRLQHLITLGQPSQEHHVDWNKQRLDRILVDHMLRDGYNETATMLAEESGIQDLVDANIFAEAHRVVQALWGRDCREALTWCADNKSKLKRIESNLEFKLRLQEFIELVRSGARMEAILYARRHLAEWAKTDMGELQKYMAALAFKPGTACYPYMVLFDSSQWDMLTDLFLNELYRLHSLTPASLLHIHLQAGLSALKTTHSPEERLNKEDPLSLPEFRQLAAGLPSAKHGRSKLVCSVTKEMMNEHNPPMVMPNGYVYSQAAVDIISARNGGKMVCPVTGQQFDAPLCGEHSWHETVSQAPADNRPSGMP